ncbi:MAG: response regulator, partial [Candidatus Obscuribacterales bacterium]|nr:response regulator [Candidatus Obscuribacterales bacterium]
ICSKLISSFDEFLLKPVKRSHLLETVKRLSYKSFKRNSKEGDAKQSKIGPRENSVDATEQNLSDNNNNNNNNNNAIAKNNDSQELSDERNITHKELILVVEDHEINQKVAILLLGKMGFKVHIADNGKEAFAILSKATHPYSLVLMDVQMPIMGGLEAARQIRKSEIGTGKHVPIIAMTAHVLEGSQEACFASGMDDYISKPIDQTILLETIEKWLPTENSDAKSKNERKRNEVGSKHKIIDLNELRSRYGHARSDALLKLFVDDTGLRLAAIKQLTEEGDQPALIFALHQLKGAAASLLAHSMRTSCMNFENHLSERGLDNAEDLFEKLANEFATLQSFLQRANVDLCTSITTASKPTQKTD